ncbi:hypothetical protein QA635_07890 [Bradyrhizobium brasilense]|uniref:hypothetical protein n=1 Tax=Bradyrhizobium brasilense TaxID=1419277 RepID=UPI0024B1D2D6|nr:hypothetical protein [Bradyrhizobium australafricanum]WFU34339.1 hypothetical protein QA635_07890 [Bradyrhizobium australafricanum]
MTMVNARPAALLFPCKYNGRRTTPGPDPKDNTMKRPHFSVTITLALLGSAGFAAAQKADTAQADLTSSQQQIISQGLRSSPSQSAPGGTQPQDGSKRPKSMNAQGLPNNVTDQVPEVTSLLFVKLPDRIVLINPDTKLVTEIVGEPTTSGSSSENIARRSSCGAGTVPPCS